MPYKHVELAKASGIKQEINSLSCSELACLMLLFNLLRATCRYFFRFPLPQLLKTIKDRCHQASPFFA
jgi:hypothetical protein